MVTVAVREGAGLTEKLIPDEYNRAVSLAVIKKKAVSPCNLPRLKCFANSAADLCRVTGMAIYTSPLVLSVAEISAFRFSD